MPTLSPSLNFAGNAAQAMRFYADVFGGELTILTFAEFGIEGVACGTPARRFR